MQKTRFTRIYEEIVVLDTQLDYPAYHDKTLLDMCWDYDLKSYAFGEEGIDGLTSLVEDSTLFDTKVPLKINDQDPTEEDLEKNVDFECGPSCVCDNCDVELTLYDPKYKHQREETPEPEGVYFEKGIGRCECTLIQSFDDLNAAMCLFESNCFPQCVFYCTQSVEKCLKSLCSLLDLCFIHYICYHDGRSLLSLLHQNRFQEYEDTSLFSKLVYLCSRFESIGSSSWDIEECLSIRSRYFHYDKGHFYVRESYPGLVYDYDAASKALSLAEEILAVVASVSEETLLGRESANDGTYMHCTHIPPKIFLHPPVTFLVVKCFWLLIESKWTYLVFWIVFKRIMRKQKVVKICQLALKRNVDGDVESAKALII